MNESSSFSLAPSKVGVSNSLSSPSDSHERWRLTGSVPSRGKWCLVLEGAIW